MRKRVEPPPAKDIPDEEDSLIINMRLQSGKFESSINIPLAASAESKRAFVNQWLLLIDVGLKCSPERKQS